VTVLFAAEAEPRVSRGRLRSSPGWRSSMDLKTALVIVLLVIAIPSVLWLASQL
jgi:hypothetical protein